MGLFADSALQPRWVVEAFARVAASEFAEIARIECAGGPPRAVPWLYRVERDAPEDLARYVPHQSLPRHELDVAFALGALDDSALDGIARLGVWRFHADGVREVLDGAPLTPAGLAVRLAPGAAPRLAYQSWSRTERLSIARNRGQLLAKASEFAWRALRDAQRFGRGWLEQCKPLPPRPGATPVAPLAAFVTLARNRGRALISSLREVEESHIAIRRGHGAIGPGLEGFTRLPGQGRTPFALRQCVFYEQGGQVAVVEVRADGRATPPVRVAEGEYPFVVEDEGQAYLTVSQQGEVHLYRALDFPRRWQLERVLLEGERLARATPHRGAERWWLFAAGRFDEELHLYHAPRLRGPWQPHPRNPVKSDARSARPAGKLYWRNGALYRPAEILAPLEGAGVSVNRVLRLTPHDYAERQVDRIPGIRCLSVGELTALDAFTRRPRFPRVDP